MLATRVGATQHSGQLHTPNFANDSQLRTHHPNTIHLRLCSSLSSFNHRTLICQLHLADIYSLEASRSFSDSITSTRQHLQHHLLPPHSRIAQNVLDEVRIW